MGSGNPEDSLKIFLMCLILSTVSVKPAVGSSRQKLTEQSDEPRRGKGAKGRLWKSQACCPHIRG